MDTSDKSNTESILIKQEQQEYGNTTIKYGFHHNPPGYFIVVDIKSSLGHEANTSLWWIWLVKSQKVDVWGFIGDLVVAD